MKEVKITAVNEQGNKAIRKHMDEFKKMSLKDRLIFKVAGYKQEVVSEDPYILLLTLNNMHSKNPIFVDLIIGEIKKALSSNGATPDTDFKVEVTENA